MRAPGEKEQLRRRLYIAAHKEVSKVSSVLPQELQLHAKRIPVHFEMTPRLFELKDGIEPDTLGLFSGDTYAEGSSPVSVIPAQITLFMENIWEFARRDSENFREEIRRTYLHELGHYLGLDEDDLTARNLD